MPYLAGIQADCLPLLLQPQRGVGGGPSLLEGVLVMDLDCPGACSPELGGPADDYWVLPYARQLEAVFEVCGCVGV